MPTFEITSPDGETFEIEGPEGSTVDEAISFAQNNLEALRAGKLKKPTEQNGFDVGRVARNIGIGSQAALEGLVGPVYDIAALPFNAFGANIPSFRQQIRAASPFNDQTVEEQTVSDITRGVTGAIPFLAAGAASPALSVLAQAPKTQVASNVANELAQSVARRGGGDETQQALMGLLAGLGTAGVSSAIQKFALPRANQASIRTLQERGVPVTVGQAMGGQIAPSIEGGIAQMPVTGASTRGTLEKQASMLQKEVSKTFSDYLHSGVDDLATATGKGIKEGITRRGDLMNRLYDRLVWNKVPKNTKISVDNSSQAVQQFLQKYAGNPDAAKFAGYDSLEELQNAIKGPLTIDAAKSFKKSIFDASDAAFNKGNRELSSAFTSIYRAFSSDIDSTIQKINPQAAQGMKVADRYYQSYARSRDIIKPLADKVDANKFEAILADVTRAAQDGRGANASTIKALKRFLKPEQFNAVMSDMLTGMGYREINGTPTFSPSKFVSDYNTLTPVAKEATKKMIGEESFSAFEKLVGAMKVANIKQLNPSGTAGGLSELANILNIFTFGFGNPVSAVSMAGIPAANLMNFGPIRDNLVKVINGLPRAELRKAILRPAILIQAANQLGNQRQSNTANSGLENFTNGQRPSYDNALRITVRPQPSGIPLNVNPEELE